MATPYITATPERDRLCFECGSGLIGPLCPICNPRNVGIPYYGAAVLSVGCFGLGVVAAIFLHLQ